MPDDLHWFCPRSSLDEHGDYYDDDVRHLISTETEEERQYRHGKVKEAADRKKLVNQACKILAFDGADAQPYQEQIKHNLKLQLTRCTVCVREYHRGRTDLIHDLEEEYGPEEVEGFMERFDRMNIERITGGLDSANATLLDLEPTERKISALPHAEMFALFECMHCMPLLRNEELLQAHFDQPFRLVQTKNRISLPEYTPALTTFLFGHNHDRLDWALRAWKKFKRNITASEFDWTVRDTFREAMTRVNITALDRDFMPTFWRGAHAIVDKLDQGIITHHLRALDVDICRLALDNLQVDSDCYSDLLTTLQLLLEKAPKDVWDAFGTISPQTVVEQIFNNTHIERVMLTTGEHDLPRLEALLGWIDPFVKSIKASNLPPACRSILQQLAVRFQNDRFSQAARKISWRSAMLALVQALSAMQQIQTGGAAIADMLQMICAHRDAIFGHIERSSKSSVDAPDLEIDLQVIKEAISLDCHSLAFDRDAIATGKTLAHDINISSLDICKSAVRGVRSGTLSLAVTVVSSVSRLLTLEPLTLKQVESASKVALAWNRGLDRIQGLLVELLGRMEDQDPDELQTIFASQESANAFCALLFSGNKRVCEAAVTVLKVACSESTRSDAVRYLIYSFYEVSLTAFSASFRAVARSKSLLPSHTTLLLGGDFLE